MQNQKYKFALICSPSLVNHSQSGTMEVINTSTKYKCTLHFKSVDFLGRDAHKIEGHMYDPK